MRYINLLVTYLLTLRFITTRRKSCGNELDDEVRRNVCVTEKKMTTLAPSTSDAAQTPPRRRKTTSSGCCGLYTPTGPRRGDHPRRAVGVGQPASAQTEGRSIWYGFANHSKIHGMKSIYRAEGQ